ncbi:MAG TPA: homoserine dehydrogenase [Pirellulales bacterium]|jgi:homoserine dehydrogenase|nr:homoserine dehydrogenase [Pirellulales bacterium]
MSNTKVAIVGLGTVGTGVARLLLDFGDRIARHAGRKLDLVQVVVKDLGKAGRIRLPGNILSDDITRITRDAQITTVALLIGGLEPARTIMLDLLAAGKDIVTANKALLAAHGPELFDRARELGRSIAFEASVAGGIPIVANISQCLSANQIQSIHAILNGTSNYILTQMEAHGTSYADAVTEAQRYGYAEADPTMDVDGSDAAQKLAILAHLAFGARVDWNDIPRQGIDTLDLADLRYSKELGYRIKLLAVAQLADDGLELHVSPTLVRLGSPLAEVRGAYNAISVVGDAVGRVFFSGLGAGQMPTASAVVADLIDMVVGRSKITFRTLELWSKHGAQVAASDYSNVAGRYYLRFNVDDQASVLAEIAGALGDEAISIASVIQHEAADESRDVVPLVIMTHNTTEGAVRQAIGAIDQLPCMRGPSVRMRVRD